MESSPLLQIQVTHPTAMDNGLHSSEQIARLNSFVQAVEKVMHKKNKSDKVRIPHTNHLAAIPDKLIHDIVHFSPEAMKCSHGEECPYVYSDKM